MGKKASELFVEYMENDPYGKIKETEILACFIDFKAGFDSRQPEIDNIRKVLENALRIEALWIADSYSMEHEGEAKALQSMKDGFLKILADSKEKSNGD